jgi:single-strand DNA-binding protein
MNIIALTGRLGKDPELKQTPGGTGLVKFTVAVDRPGKSKETDWFDCTAFGKTAEFVKSWFKKGSWIEITGSMQMNSYTAKDGAKRTAWGVIVDRAGFVGAKETPQGQPQLPPQVTAKLQELPTDQPLQEYSDDEDIPF